MKPSSARPTPAFPQPKPAPRGSTARISRQVVGLAASGEEVSLFVLDTGCGSAAQVLDYGATVAALHVPDARGDSGPVVLAPGSLQGHLADRMYLGATVGRFANRIAGACFILDDRRYQLQANEGTNQLHGGGRWVSCASEAGDLEFSPAGASQLTIHWGNGRRTP